MPTELTPRCGWCCFRHELGCSPLSQCSKAIAVNTNIEMQSLLYLSPYTRFVPLIYIFNFLLENAAWGWVQRSPNPLREACAVTQPLYALRYQPSFSLFCLHWAPFSRPRQSRMEVGTGLVEVGLLSHQQAAHRCLRP